ncbi:hypothetical protein LQZ18_02870 [Lachnospiraceae bacterium ZAX-1]
MSNLGGYQILTTLAKKVGGPGKLVALIAGGGAVVGGIVFKGGELAIKKCKKAIAERRVQNKRLHERTQIIYTVKQDGEGNDGLKLKVGDTFRVLESDGDAILIELIGNKNNPYFVSKDLLGQISDFNGSTH